MARHAKKPLMNLPEAGKFHDIKRHDPPTVGFRLFILEKDLAVFDLPQSTLHSPCSPGDDRGKSDKHRSLISAYPGPGNAQEIVHGAHFLCIKPFFADLA